MAQGSFRLGLGLQGFSVSGFGVSGFPGFRMEMWLLGRKVLIGVTRFCHGIYSIKNIFIIYCSLFLLRL